MQHICFNASISSGARRRAGMSSQYPSLVNSLSYGSKKQVCAPSHSAKLELSFILLFKGRGERRELLSSDSTISSVTAEKILLSTSWSRALTNPRFHVRSWKGRNYAFLRRFSGCYFCFSIVFCHFPSIIVQILSVEQKLLLGIEHPFKITTQYDTEPRIDWK